MNRQSDVPVGRKPSRRLLGPESWQGCIERRDPLWRSGDFARRPQGVLSPPLRADRSVVSSRRAAIRRASLLKRRGSRSIAAGSEAKVEKGRRMRGSWLARHTLVVNNGVWAGGVLT